MTHGIRKQKGFRWFIFGDQVVKSDFFSGIVLFFETINRIISLPLWPQISVWVFIANYSTLITKYFIRKRILKALESPRPANLIDFTEAKNIAVVSSVSKELRYEDAGEVLKRFTDWSENQFYFYTTPKLQMSDAFIGGNLHSITRKDFTFFGFPKRHLIELLRSQEFDLLINIDISNHIFSHFLSTEIPAKFKVGLSVDAYTNVYDLTLRVAANSSTNDFFNHLNFYLKALKGKSHEK